MTEPYKNIRLVLAECRDIAMEWTMRGRIPECGKFSEIAQNLDYVCAELENSTQWNPITDAEPDEWKLAVDHELTNMQSTADSYPSAKEAVKALINWHFAVATDHQLAAPKHGEEE